MTGTTYERVEARSRRLLRQEELILDVTERICEALAQQRVTRTELARRLEVTKSHVSHLLAGNRNLTLRTLADVAEALDLTPELTLRAKFHTDVAHPERAG